MSREELLKGSQVFLLEGIDMSMKESLTSMNWDWRIDIPRVYGEVGEGV